MNDNVSNMSDEVLLSLSPEDQGHAIVDMAIAMLSEGGLNVRINDDLLLRLTEWGQANAMEHLPVERIDGWSDEFLFQLKDRGQANAIERMSTERANMISFESWPRLHHFAQAEIAKKSEVRINDISDDILLQLDDYARDMTISRMSLERLRNIDRATLNNLSDSNRAMVNSRISALAFIEIHNSSMIYPPNQPPMQNENQNRSGCEML